MTTYVNVRHNATLNAISALNEGLDPKQLVQTFEDQISKMLARYEKATRFKLDIKRDNPTVASKMEVTEKVLKTLTASMDNHLDMVSNFLEVITPGHAMNSNELLDLNLKMLDEATHRTNWFKRGNIRLLRTEVRKVWEV